LRGLGALAALAALLLSPLHARAVEDGVPEPLSASEPEPSSASQLLDRAYQSLYGADFVQVVRMTSRARSGRALARRLQLTRKQSVQPGKWLVRFIEPTQVRGTSLLVLEQTSRDDDVFVYLPALRKVRRLSSAQRYDSFFGTDLSYEDLEPKRAADYEASIVGGDAVEGTPCTLVEARPRPEVSSEYERSVACIDPLRAVALRIDYYRRGVPYKRLEVSRVERVEDRFIPFDVRVLNLARGSETRIETESYELRAGIPDSLFTAASLEQGDEERDRAHSESGP
jgi:hypothetical protein